LAFFPKAYLVQGVVVIWVCEGIGIDAKNLADIDVGAVGVDLRVIGV